MAFRVNKKPRCPRGKGPGRGGAPPHSPRLGQGGLGAARLTREAQPQPGPDPRWPLAGQTRGNPEKGEGSSHLARPAAQAKSSNRGSWPWLGVGRREGAVSTGTAAWPCPRATGRPPQLLLSSPAGDQTADKAAVSFPV
jgi:hypothetical protein